MDPVTALADTATAFFNFCSTPAGQTFVTQAMALNQTIVSDIAGITHAIAGAVVPKAS
ncbi:MAG TPA: hypothetical protein VK752_05285 [Bryobacteraceae bacterium]|jgi:hypothetical protein|nr:hypothetical protein [Bryobacteraceae bacterium]